MSEFDAIKRQMNMQHGFQKELQDDSLESQARLVAPQLREQVAEVQAAIIAQTNPARALRVILEGFKGNMINEYGDLEAIGKPLVNQEGISRIASMLIPFVNDPIRFGKISHVEVREIALQVINDITEDIGIYWREYGIQSPPIKDLLIDSCLALIFITLTRSEEGDDKRFLSRVILESLGTKTGQKKEEQSNWFSKLKLG